MGNQVRQPQRDIHLRMLRFEWRYMKLKDFALTSSVMDCFYFWEVHNSHYWASLHILFLGGAVAVPHYFTSEVTARLCEVVAGRAVNRSPGAAQSSAKLQSLSHSAFQDESDESVLVCQCPGPELLHLTALPGPRLDPDRRFATVVGASCGACSSVWALFLCKGWSTYRIAAYLCYQFDSLI